MANARTVAQNRQEAGTKYADADARIQRMWQSDKDALMAEHTRICPWCERTLEPVVHLRDARPPMGRWIAAIPERITIHSRQLCGCAGERAAIQQEQDGNEDTAFDALQRASTLNKSGLVGWLASATFDTYAADNHNRKMQRGLARQYCDALLGDTLADAPWLIFYGPLGTGKTHLAAAILHEALTAGWERCYLRVWPDWVKSMQASFDDRKLSTSALLNELQHGKLVAMDDIDKSQMPTEKKPMEWRQETLYTVLNERYNRRLPTILTFNRTPTEMTPWLGGPIVDRLIEIQFQIVQFNGKSYRSDLDLPWK